MLNGTADAACNSFASVELSVAEQNAVNDILRVQLNINRDVYEAVISVVGHAGLLEGHNVDVAHAAAHAVQ